MFRLLFCFLNLLIFNLPAQELFFSQPSNFQNLPSQETYSVFQDSRGFIWITTDAGICRYDGNNLTVFTVKDGIPENVVFKIYEDDKGRVWFSSLSGYLFYYKEGKFNSIHANEELKKICHSAHINTFFVGNEDTLFVTTGGSSAGGVKGFIKVVAKNNYSTILIDSVSFLSWSRFYMTNPKHPLQLLIGPGGSPVKNKSPELTAIYNKVTFPMTIRQEDWNGSTNPLGTVDRVGNLYTTVGKQLNIYTKTGALKGKYNFDSHIYSCYVDAEDDLWICTAKGGYLFKNSDIKKTPVSFLNMLPVSSIFVDREGTVWVATLEKGILKSMNKEILFFDTEKDTPVHFQKGLNQLNITYTSQQILSIYKNDSVFRDNKLKIILAPDEKLTFSFIDDNFYYLQINIQFLIWDRKKKVFLNNNTFLNIKETLKIGKDSMLFISAPHFVTFYNKKDNILRPPFPIRSALQLNNKKVLLSSRNNSGIYEFTNDKFIPYLPQLKQLKTRINCMIEDAQNNLWLATNEYGLYCYDRFKQLHHYTTANGIISDKINTLTIDDQHNLWLGSYNGLTKLTYADDLRKFQVTNFDKSHGLPSLQIEKITAFNGKVFCIAKNICFFFNEKRLKKNITPPLNYIQSVSINNNNYSLNSTAVLSYDQNNLRILASPITYKNTEQKKFLYKLNGYDEEWHASTTGEIQYTNLPHGKYNFVVYGLNNDNIKSTTPATFAFIIKRPFWLTWWFIAMEIILFCIISFFTLRFWKNKIQKKEHNKALLTEFKMTALRSQMNPHFIFNAIGSIQHYILKNEIKQSYNYLSKFSMLIRNILNNSKEEYISLSQEINTLRLYIELEQIRFTNPFKFVIEVDEKLDMDMDIPTMLIQPYVENSIWHGLMPKESDAILELFFKKEEDALFVVIRDNGIGRKIKDPSQKTHISKGMSITEQRIQTLQATNQKKFVAIVVDLKDENNNSAGTEVQITIPFDL